MEDLYDVKMSKIGGKTNCLLGIFDRHGGSHAVEFLKERLFENLTRHLQLITNTKLTISETYQKTDIDFLEAQSNICKDDSYTISASVLVGSHLYVGDSRAVASKEGKDIPLSKDHKPN
uniref:PPM-type phosphatase domain-containing protein n=1 Tax=Nelumbo nucifera TaxID=4432 RepID=A0A822Z860_NELNU|nr:TPA_asm: hypothetical protein HUJ06_013988 [Nelumbo nucifera]